MSGVPFDIGWGEGFALLSSLAYSVTLVSLRQGMRSGTPLAALLLICSCNAVTGFTAAYLRGSFALASLGPMLLFVLGGCFSQGLGNLSQFIGIERMGVSRAAPIAASTPIWSVALAVMFLGERPGAAVVAGAVCIVAGVFLLSLARGEGVDFRNWFTGALVFPLAASLSYAIGPIFSKTAFGMQPTPMLGMAVAFATGGLVMLLTHPLQPGGGAIRADRRAKGWFAFAALFNVIASTTMWLAIFLGDISIVIPLSRIVPLWVLLWSYLFLGQLERITHRVFFAAAMVVVGGVMVTLFK